MTLLQQVCASEYLTMQHSQWYRGAESTTDELTDVIKYVICSTECTSAIDNQRDYQSEISDRMQALTD